jgi:hypothetical protein
MKKDSLNAAPRSLSALGTVLPAPSLRGAFELNSRAGAPFRGWRLYMTQERPLRGVCASARLVAALHQIA